MRLINFPEAEIWLSVVLDFRTSKYITWLSSRNQIDHFVITEALIRKSGDALNDELYCYRLGKESFLVGWLKGYSLSRLEMSTRYAHIYVLLPLRPYLHPRSADLNTSFILLSVSSSLVCPLNCCKSLNMSLGSVFLKTSLSLLHTSDYF